MSGFEIRLCREFRHGLRLLYAAVFRSREEQWRPLRHLFQLQVDGKKKTIADKGEVPFAVESLRAFSDRVSADRRDSVIKGGSRPGLRLNAATDFRKTARVEKPKLTAVDRAQVAHARNLWAQLERIAAAE